MFDESIKKTLQMEEATKNLLETAARSLSTLQPEKTISVEK